MIESKCPKCEKHFLSKVLETPYGFTDAVDKPFMETYDWSLQNYLQEGYYVKCPHCQQLFKINFKPIIL